MSGLAVYHSLNVADTSKVTVDNVLYHPLFFGLQGGEGFVAACSGCSSGGLVPSRSSLDYSGEPECVSNFDPVEADR
jgi:hypothetical protein